MPISLRIGPFTTTIAEAELEVLPRAETCEAAIARMTGKYSGRAPGHDGVHRDLLDRVFPGHAELGRLHVADDLVGRVAGVRPAWRRRASRSAARSEACRSSCSRGTCAADCLRCPARADAASCARTRQPQPTCCRRRPSAAGQRLDDLLHDRAAGDRVLAVRRRPRSSAAVLPMTGCGTKARGACGRPAIRVTDCDHPVELVGVQRDGRHAVFGLERDGVGGDRRRAVAAMADADDGGVAVAP